MKFLQHCVNLQLPTFVVLAVGLVADKQSINKLQ